MSKTSGLHYAIAFLAAFLAGCDSYGLEEVTHDVSLDLRYATTRNFTGSKLYWEARCFLRSETADKLRAADEELRGVGLRLRVLDCYRPLSVQRKMWSLVPDERYVANPDKGSRHNRGAAVDVTLIRASDGTELFMPSEYDDFSSKAHRDYNQLQPEQIANRRQLQDVMSKHGFEGLATEWWHFDDSDWQKFPLLDVDIETLRPPKRSLGNN